MIVAALVRRFSSLASATRCDARRCLFWLLRRAFTSTLEGVGALYALRDAGDMASMVTSNDCHAHV